MSTHDHGSEVSAEATEYPVWWEAEQSVLLRERKAEQVRRIVAAFEAVGTPVGIYPSDDRPEDMEYMYRKGYVLTRDADIGRVHEALGREPGLSRKSREELSPPIAGLHLVPLSKSEEVIRTLERLDAALGAGVVTPDHVVHLTGNGGSCPATEPLPSAGSPVPPISSDDSCNGSGVLVSVIDTGLLTDVVAAHSWLAGITGDPELATVGHYTGHGTFVAGVVRAMAPRAQIHVEPLLYVGGAVFESDLSSRLSAALDTMPDIISMSAGTTTRYGQPLLGLEVFWEERLSKTKGTILVCAAGNDGNRGPFNPATMPWTVSVGALDADGKRAGYSNFGSWVDVYARGSDIVNAYPKGLYKYQEPPLAGQSANFITGMANWSGTSFSTPLVSGLIAARMSWSGESAREAADALLELARVNATAGVGKVLEPGMACRPVACPPTHQDLPPQCCCGR